MTEKERMLTEALKLLGSVHRAMMGPTPPYDGVGNDMSQGVRYVEQVVMMLRDDKLVEMNNPDLPYLEKLLVQNMKDRNELHRAISKLGFSLDFSTGTRQLDEAPWEVRCETGYELTAKKEI